MTLLYSYSFFINHPHQNYENGHVTSISRSNDITSGRIECVQSILPFLSCVIDNGLYIKTTKNAKHHALNKLYRICDIHFESLKPELHFN